MNDLRTLISDQGMVILLRKPEYRHSIKEGELRSLISQSHIANKVEPSSSIYDHAARTVALEAQKLSEKELSYFESD